ncbi:MAG: hypothetical protein IKU06_04705 [Lachnospiraceae bacterium]|nr:hypothetical protein [Lachnospiraceae bacterium]
MIKKLLLTLKYGEKKARTVLSIVLILIIAGLVLLVLGITGSSLIMLGGGALLMISGLLVLFSFSFVDIDVSMADKNKDTEKKEKKEKKDKAGPAAKKDDTEGTDNELAAGMEDIDFSMLAEDLSDVAIGVEGLALGSLGENLTDKDESSDKKEKTEEDAKAEEDLLTEEIVKKAEQINKELSTDVSDKKIRHVSDLEDEDGDKASKEGEKTEKEKPKPTPKQIKARKKMLRVRRDDRRYTPVFIDSWNEVSAHRVPAFIQDKGKTANIVLVESALRTELMPMKDFLKVTYKKNVEDRMAESYEEIRNDKEVNALFGDLLPALYPGSNMNDTSVLYKNLYVLGGKIAVTPRSLRKLFNKFDFEFKVFDSLNLKGNYSKYFKMAYENRIFWTDNVITQNDYQDRIRGLLQTMVEDDKISTSEFENDLEMMVRYNLITKEYADYYSARKTDKIRIRI